MGSESQEAESTEHETEHLKCEEPGTHTGRYRSTMVVFLLVPEASVDSGHLWWPGAIWDFWNKTNLNFYSDTSVHLKITIQFLSKTSPSKNPQDPLDQNWYLFQQTAFILIKLFVIFGSKKSCRKNWLKKMIALHLVYVGFRKNLTLRLQPFYLENHAVLFLFHETRQSSSWITVIILLFGSTFRKK